MVRVTLQPAPGSDNKAPVDIDAGSSVTENIGQLEHKLGLDLEKQKAVAVDASGVAVDFKEPTTKKNAPGVAAAKYYVVVNLQETENDTVQPWRIDEADAIGTALEQQVKANETDRVQRAMMSVYSHGYASVGESQQFPDYNQNARAAYSAGLDAQVPEAIAKAAGEDFDDFQVGLLRRAFKLGMDGKAEATKAVPSTEDLREAYKRGKEAVYLSIPDQKEWESVKLETFKLCSVPVEYAQYMGGVSMKLKDQQNYRDLCRAVFHLGVEDAWKARSEVHVSAKKAVERIPESPSVQDAYAAGQKAAKLADSNAQGSTLKVDDGKTMRLTLVQGPDSSESASTAMFAEGLNAMAAQIHDAKAALPADERAPDTMAETKEKVKTAYAEKMKRDKEKEKEKREEERQAAEDAAKQAEEKTFFEKCCLMPLAGCYDACCPMCTWEEGEECKCCSTTCGDWALILFLFAIYYAYLGMWYWAFIEILMTVQEPKRPF